MPGEGLSGPREGCGGLGSVCLPSQGVDERGQWVGGVIRVGVGGGPLRAKRGLWGVGVCVLSFIGRGRERAVGGWCDQAGRWGRAIPGRERAMGGSC